MNSNLPKPDGSPEIIVILDRSGSMTEVASDAIGGFNTFVDGQRAGQPDAKLTLILFDNRYEVAFDSVPLVDFPALTAETYIPRGSTALYDAIGRTITVRSAAFEALPAGRRPAAVVVAILTDGFENSSRRFTGPEVQKLIGQMRDQGWEFIFLAADQDAIASARSLNIPEADAIQFSKEGHGTMETFSHLDEKVSEKLAARPDAPGRSRWQQNPPRMRRSSLS